MGKLKIIAVTLIFGLMLVCCFACSQADNRVKKWYDISEIPTDCEYITAMSILSDKGSSKFNWNTINFLQTKFHIETKDGTIIKPKIYVFDANTDGMNKIVDHVSNWGLGFNEYVETPHWAAVYGNNVISVTELYCDTFDSTGILWDVGEIKSKTSDGFYLVAESVSISRAVPVENGTALSPISFNDKEITDNFNIELGLAVQDDPRAAVRYYVYFNSSPGTFVEGFDVLPNSKIPEVTNPTYTNHAFGGWYKEAACINEWNFEIDTVNKNTTLYAKWEKAITYTVTFNSLGSTVNTVSGVALGGKISKPFDPTNSTDNFGGWYKEATCINEWNFETDTVNKNTTLYAKWTAKKSFSVSNVKIDCDILQGIEVSFSYTGNNIKNLAISILDNANAEIAIASITEIVNANNEKVYFGHTVIPAKVQFIATYYDDTLKNEVVEVNELQLYKVSSLVIIKGNGVTSGIKLDYIGETKREIANITVDILTNEYQLIKQEVPSPFSSPNEHTSIRIDFGLVATPSYVRFTVEFIDSTIQEQVLPVVNIING